MAKQKDAQQTSVQKANETQDQVSNPVSETATPVQTQDVTPKETPKETPERDHLHIYNQARSVPSMALKTIQAGKLKGFSDINPMWRIKRITEIFGACGFGWYYNVDKQWTETYGQEVKCFCNVSLFVRDADTGQWSAPIFGTGGSSIVSVNRNGVSVDDEGYKMALTDALSIAMKNLGVGADVWYGKDVAANVRQESKYDPLVQQAPAPAKANPADAERIQIEARIKTLPEGPVKEAANVLMMCETMGVVKNAYQFFKDEAKQDPLILAIGSYLRKTLPE